MFTWVRYNELISSLPRVSLKKKTWNPVWTENVLFKKNPQKLSLKPHLLNRVFLILFFLLIDEMTKNNVSILLILNGRNKKNARRMR